MTDSTVAQPDPAAPDSEQMRSALFAHLVMQQSNMAMMLLGKTPHPETGEVIRDPETARMFIDLLEMLEAKTKGNLTKEEASLLKSALMATRMAFVETANAPAPSPSAANSAALEAGPAAATPPGEPSPAAEEECRKKFTKKY